MPTPNEQRIIGILSPMTIDEARRTIVNGKFGHKGTDGHKFASEWLEAKEAFLRDERESKTLAIAEDANRLASDANSIACKAFSEARRANRSRWKDRTIAITAIIIAMISAHKEIKLVVSWLSKIIKGTP